jgi:hypothetical protein
VIPVYSLFNSINACMQKFSRGEYSVWLQTCDLLSDSRLPELYTVGNEPHNYIRLCHMRVSFLVWVQVTAEKKTDAHCIQANMPSVPYKPQ